MGVPMFFPYNVLILLSEGIHDILDGIMYGYLLTSKQATS
jgi:hypothetical protein